jgi:hypothetical protein
VTFGVEGSGNTSTRKPLSRRYSVIPSTEATRFSGPDSALATGSAVDTLTISNDADQRNRIDLFTGCSFQAA